MVLDAAVNDLTVNADFTPANNCSALSLPNSATQAL
jgi:hypothetical protein